MYNGTLCNKLLLKDIIYNAIYIFFYLVCFGSGHKIKIGLRTAVSFN